MPTIIEFDLTHTGISWVSWHTNRKFDEYNQNMQLYVSATTKYRDVGLLRYENIKLDKVSANKNWLHSHSPLFYGAPEGGPVYSVYLIEEVYAL